MLPFVACCVLALGVLGADPATGRAMQAPADSAAVAGDVGGSVAVSTFANVTRDPADDWLGEGIAETVAADLGAAGLTVVGRGPAAATTGAAPDGSPAGVLSLGRALGARWIVTGGYQRLGERLRITARLVDVTTGAVRRAVRADGATGELFALQDRIAAGLLSDGAPAETGACRHGGACRGGGRPPSGPGTAPARRRNLGRRTACDGTAGRGSSSLGAARNAGGGRPGEPDGGARRPSSPSSRGPAVSRLRARRRRVPRPAGWAASAWRARPAS